MPDSSSADTVKAGPRRSNWVLSRLAGMLGMVPTTVAEFERRSGRVARGVDGRAGSGEAAPREQVLHPPAERPTRAFGVAAHAEIDAGLHPVEGLDPGHRLERDVHCQRLLAEAPPEILGRKSQPTAG